MKPNLRGKSGCMPTDDAESGKIVELEGDDGENDDSDDWYGKPWKGIVVESMVRASVFPVFVLFSASRVRTAPLVSTDVWLLFRRMAVGPSPGTRRCTFSVRMRNTTQRDCGICWCLAWNASCLTWPLTTSHAIA
jgi:hypothetical protein